MHATRGVQIGFMRDLDRLLNNFQFISNNPQKLRFELIIRFKILGLILCNTTYKIVSKVLAERLKNALNEVVDWHQSDFLLDRQITDNII